MYGRYRFSRYARADTLSDVIPQLVDFHVQLSATSRGARLARLLAVEQLRGWGLPLEGPAHIVAELAANAVTHGRVPGRDFRMVLTVTPGLLRIEVTDARGDRIPEKRDGGRGLLLVEAFADRWGVREGPVPRKVVWAEVEWGTGARGAGGRGASGPAPEGEAWSVREEGGRGVVGRGYRSVHYRR